MTVNPGWYEDGVTPGVERWFDGRAWTATTRPVAPTAAVPTPPAPTPAAPTPAAPTPAAPTGAAAAGAAWMPQTLPPAEAPSAATAGYPAAGYPAAGYPATGYPTTGYPATGAPAAGYPAAGFPAGGFQQGGYSAGGFQQGGYPAAGASAQQGADHRQTAIVSGAIGIALLVAAGVVLRLTVDSGTGRVWTWGFVAGALLLGRGVISYVKAVRAGAPHFGPLGWGVAVVGVVAAVVVAVSSIQTAFGPVDVAVGDCFTDEGAEVQQVGCSQGHDYVVLDIVSAIDQCPSLTTVYTRTDDGELACLGADG